MGVLKYIFTVVLFLISGVAKSAILDGTFSGSSTTYKESKQSATGISARLRYREFGGGESHGSFILADMPGISPLYGQFAYGYGWSTKGTASIEVAAGASYSLIWSIGGVVLLGSSIELGSGMYLSLPLFLFTTVGIQFTPYIGWRF